MNTNSKHYETLNIQPWEIMERNFTTEEFVAYLKGNIIKYTLRDKGQALTDAEKIKHYAEKLIEVLESVEEPEVKHKFKIGDRVRVTITKEEGTIIRLPKKGLSRVDKDNYIVELDKEYSGWPATFRRHAVNSENAWYASDAELELLKEENEPKKTLKPNKWYDAEDFTVEELKELLPVGTKVVVTYPHDNGREVDFEAERLLNTLVKNIGIRDIRGETRVGVTKDCWWRRHFKITEE